MCFEDVRKPLEDHSLRCLFLICARNNLDAKLANDFIIEENVD